MTDPTPDGAWVTAADLADAAWLARLARGGSWWSESMAQSVEDAANRIIALNEKHARPRPGGQS